MSLPSIELIMQARLTPSEIENSKESGSYPEEPLGDLAMILWKSPNDYSVRQVVNLERAHEPLYNNQVTFLPRSGSLPYVPASVVIVDVAWTKGLRSDALVRVNAPAGVSVTIMGNEFISEGDKVWTLVPNVLRYRSEYNAGENFAATPGHRSLLYYRVFAPPVSMALWHGDAEPLVVFLGADEEQSSPSTYRTTLETMEMRSREYVDAITLRDNDPRSRVPVNLSIYHARRKEQNISRLISLLCKNGLKDVPSDLTERLSDYLHMRDKRD